MKKRRYTEEQIIGFLREADKGVAVKELCRKHGFSEASYYLWRSKFGGMDVSDAKRLKALEAENAQAEEAAGRVDARERGRRAKRCEKNGDRTGSTGAGAVDAAAGTVGAPRRWRSIGMSASSLRYEPRADRNAALRERIVAAGAAASPLWRRDDLPEAATGRRAA